MPDLQEKVFVGAIALKIDLGTAFGVYMGNERKGF